MNQRLTNVDISMIVICFYNFLPHKKQKFQENTQWFLLLFKFFDLVSNNMH